MSTTAHPVWLRCFHGARDVWTAWREAWTRAVRRVIPEWRSRHPFDRKHRVDTSGLIYADGLATGHEHDSQSAGYYATAPSLFHGAIRLWSQTLDGSGYRLSDYTLVDIGCGKGRAVMLASEYGFREVVGVELNSRLAAAARRNLAKWSRSPRACANVRIVHGDALSTPIPDGPVVLFFFNSFEREMVRLFLDRLAETALGRLDPIDLIYVHPEFDACVRQTRGVDLVSEAEIAFSAEDAAADVFDVDFDDCRIYRIDGFR